MRKEITVHENGEPIYEITLNETFDQLAADISRAVGATETKKVCIVSDSNVAEIYLKKICSILEQQFHTVISYIFEAGEQSKNMETVQKLY